MEKPRPYRFRTENYTAAGLVLIELWKVGDPKSSGGRSVPRWPMQTFQARLEDAKAWLAWKADVRRTEIEELNGIR